MQALTSRVVVASVPLASLLVALLGPITRQAHADVAPPPSAAPRVLGSVSKARIQTPVVLRAPDVVGQKIETARGTLEGRGLRPGRVVDRPTTDARPGIVLAQDPKPGTPIEPGSAINLWIAARPDRPASTPEPPRPPRPPRDPGRVSPPRFDVVITLPPPVPPAAPAPPRAPAAPVPPPVYTAPVPPTAPKPSPVVRPKPIVPAPAPVASSATVAPPAPVTPPPVVTPAPAVTPPVLVAKPVETPRARWPRGVVWGVASALVLTAGGAAYYRRAKLEIHATVPAPTLGFAPHWDTGAQQIGPVGPLRASSGLRLVSGLEMATSTLEDDHLVGTAHDTGGYKR
jgi:PASTA domain